MNKEQIEKLKEVALRAPKNPGEWPFYLRSFQAAASPEVILELIALAEHSLSAQDEVLTDEQIDTHINTVLRPTGTKMANFTMQKSKDDLRTAMRSVLAAATPSPSLEVRDVVNAVPIPGLPFADLATPIKEFEAKNADQG